MRILAILTLASSCFIAMLHAEVDYDKLFSLARERYGEQAGVRIEQWRALEARYAGAPERAKIEATNTFFNELLGFASDLEIWNERDYWATPLETLGKQRGDCEDFSVAKYATLLLLGVPMHKLRLVYVKASIGGPRSRVTQAHMVLAYYPTPTSDPLILDNLVTEIRPASRRPDLRPVFSFNSAGLWVGSATQPTANDPGSRLSRWQRVLLRMREEGLSYDQEEAR